MHSGGNGFTGGHRTQGRTSPLKGRQAYWSSEHG